MIASLLFSGAKTPGRDERSETLRRGGAAKNARPVAGLGGRQPPADTGHEALRHPVRRPGRGSEDQGQNLRRRGGQTAPRQHRP